MAEDEQDAGPVGTGGGSEDGGDGAIGSGTSNDVVDASGQAPLDLDSGLSPAALPEPVTADAPTFTDHARRNIAYWLLSILSGIILLSFVLLIWALDEGQQGADANFQHIAALLNIVFGPVVTLVGSAMGFYFGAQSNKPVGTPS